MKDIAVTIAGVVFLAVAVMHLVRLIFKVKVTVGNFVVPLWYSAVGFAVTLLLALWMLKSAKKTIDKWRS